MSGVLAGRAGRLGFPRGTLEEICGSPFQVISSGDLFVRRDLGFHCVRCEDERKNDGCKASGDPFSIRRHVDSPGCGANGFEAYELDK